MGNLNFYRIQNQYNLNFLSIRNTNDIAYILTMILLKIFSLNFIYFPSITQKAHGTYINILEGTGVGLMWTNLVEETGEHRENHQIWMSHH